MQKYDSLGSAQGKLGPEVPLGGSGTGGGLCIGMPSVFKVAICRQGPMADSGAL